jgi:hypothetical protein
MQKQELKLGAAATKSRSEKLADRRELEKSKKNESGLQQ